MCASIPQMIDQAIAELKEWRGLGDRLALASDRVIPFLALSRPSLPEGLL